MQRQDQWHDRHLLANAFNDLVKKLKLCLHYMEPIRQLENIVHALSCLDSRARSSVRSALLQDYAGKM